MVESDKKTQEMKANLDDILKGIDLISDEDEEEKLADLGKSIQYNMLKRSMTSSGAQNKAVAQRPVRKVLAKFADQIDELKEKLEMQLYEPGYDART
jgi:adenosine deaminase CECR1